MTEFIYLSGESKIFWFIWLLSYTVPFLMLIFPWEIVDFVTLICLSASWIFYYLYKFLFFIVFASIFTYYDCVITFFFDGIFGYP